MMAAKKILLGVAIVGLGTVTWNSNWFQRQFFPEEYWTKQVAFLEEIVREDLAGVQYSMLELNKLQRTRDLRFAQEMSFARADGLSQREAQKNAVETLRVELEEAQDDIAMSMEMLDEDREELEEARNQLAVSRR